MNILDLKKGDKVFVGLNRTGGGCAADCEYVEQLEVRAIFAYMCGQYADIRLSDGVKAVERSGQYKARIRVYNDEEQFFDDVMMEVPSQSAFVKYIAEREGYEVYNDSFPVVWKWDEASKRAYKTHMKLDDEGWNGRVNIFTYKFPEGYYPTKEACEKANRRMVTIEVTRTFLTEREEGADAEYLLNHPDEYEFQDGDECMTDAQYSD